MKRYTSGSALTVNVNDQAEQICYFSCAVFSSWKFFLTYKSYGWSLVLVAKGWPEYLGTQRLTPGLDILILTLIPWGPRLLFQTHQLYQRLQIQKFQQLLNFVNPQNAKLTLIPQGPKLTSQTHQLYQRCQIPQFQQLLHFIIPQCTKLDKRSLRIDFCFLYTDQFVYTVCSCLEWVLFPLKNLWV